MKDNELSAWAEDRIKPHLLPNGVPDKSLVWTIGQITKNISTVKMAITPKHYAGSLWMSW
jgi:hypothetical protein